MSSFEHVAAALDAAAGGAIEEGSVGGGTGMIAFGFKAGSGTASRVVEWQGTALYGRRVRAGEFRQAAQFHASRPARRADLAEPAIREGTPRAEKGSIIAIVATDAPFLPHQMKRLARRVPLGIAMTGGFGYHSSGDIFLAFSTANPEAALAPSGRIGAAPISFRTSTSTRSSMRWCRGRRKRSSMRWSPMRI